MRYSFYSASSLPRVGNGFAVSGWKKKKQLCWSLLAATCLPLSGGTAQGLRCSDHARGVCGIAVMTGQKGDSLLQSAPCSAASGRSPAAAAEKTEDYVFCDCHWFSPHENNQKKSVNAQRVATSLCHKKVGRMPCGVKRRRNGSSVGHEGSFRCLEEVVSEIWLYRW